MKKPKEPHEADVALGRRLKSLRIRRGLSQTALGEMLASYVLGTMEPDPQFALSRLGAAPAGGWEAKWS